MTDRSVVLAEAVRKTGTALNESEGGQDPVAAEIWEAVLCEFVHTVPESPEGMLELINFIEDWDCDLDPDPQSALEMLKEGIRRLMKPEDAAAA